MNWIIWIARLGEAALKLAGPVIFYDKYQQKREEEALKAAKKGEKATIDEIDRRAASQMGGDLASLTMPGASSGLKMMDDLAKRMGKDIGEKLVKGKVLSPEQLGDGSALIGQGKVGSFSGSSMTDNQYYEQLKNDPSLKQGKTDPSFSDDQNLERLRNDPSLKNDPNMTEDQYFEKLKTDASLRQGNTDPSLPDDQNLEYLENDPSLADDPNMTEDQYYEQLRNDYEKPRIKTGEELYRNALKEAGYSDDFYDTVQSFLNAKVTDRMIIKGRILKKQSSGLGDGRSLTKLPVASQPFGRVAPYRSPNSLAIEKTLYASTSFNKDFYSHPLYKKGLPDNNMLKGRVEMNKYKEVKPSLYSKTYDKASKVAKNAWQATSNAAKATWEVASKAGAKAAKVLATIAISVAKAAIIAAQAAVSLAISIVSAIIHFFFGW